MARPSSLVCLLALAATGVAAAELATTTAAPAAGGGAGGGPGGAQLCTLCKRAVGFFQIEAEVTVGGAVDTSAHSLAERIEGFCRANEDLAHEATCAKVHEIILSLGSDARLAEVVRSTPPEDVCLAVGQCAAAGPHDGEAGRPPHLRARALKDCSGTCEGGQKMVYHSWWAGCVCDWRGCKDKTFSQFNLCRRQCYSGDSGCAQCFPSGALVWARAEGGAAVEQRRMEELRVGDEVLTEAGFSPIFAFMDHAAGHEGAPYIRLDTASGASLTISDDHIVWAHEPRRLVLAGSVKRGDVLWVSNSSSPAAAASLRPSAVVRVEATAARGLHAPLTKQGSIVVDGVLASSYAKSRSLTWGQTTLVTGHSLNLFMHAPLRWACEANPKYCGPEWHSPELGRHLWTQWILERFGWLQLANHEHSDLRRATVGAEADSVSRAAALVQLCAAALLCAAYYLVFAFHPAYALCTVLAAGFGHHLLLVVRALRRQEGTAATGKARAPKTPRSAGERPRRRGLGRALRRR